MTPRLQLLDWERRWATPAALAAFAAVFLVIAAIVVVSVGVGHGSGDSEVLRDVDSHRAAELISSVLQAIGIGLIALPLVYLFRAASERSERMRGQLIGVVIAAPLFLAVAAILSGLSTLHAASSFVADEVPRLTARGIALSSDHADQVAKDEINGAPLRNLAAGFGLAGQLGFLVAMVYTCLHAMRVGLLTRFWGSLGIALGAVSFVFFQLALLWFIYLGLLLLLRGNQPPAWASGEAVPWPTPGDRAAADLQGSSEDDQLTHDQLTPPAEDEQLLPPAGDPEAPTPTDKGPSQ